MNESIKKGLEYFSFDVDFFQDEKLQFVSARFGAKGESITVRLLCKIYRQGYYTDWDSDIALLFAKGVGDGCQHTLVNDVVIELLKRDFFDKGIFERFSILTSRGIQKRYFKAIERRKKIEAREELLLVDKQDYPNIVLIKVTVNNSGKNVYIPDKNVNYSIKNVDIFEQSKVKKSKVNSYCSNETPDDSISEAVSAKEIKITKQSPPKKRCLQLTENQKQLFHTAKACFETSEKAKAIIYQDKGSTQMHMENLKLLVVRCTNMAPEITADFMRTVLEHFKIIVNGKLKGKVEFTPRALITPWIWEMVIGSLPVQDNELTTEIRESIKGMFK
jgi:hypothetical protein